MENRRYQVFVSSTFTDLVDERREVIQALLEMDCIPAGMEMFPAADEDQWTLIRKVIDNSDYYVLIVGGRYGSTTVEGISYTEKEFDYAVSQRKPILAFLHKDPDQIPVGKADIDPAAREKLAAFRKKTETGRMCKYYTGPDDLGGKVSRALNRAVNTSPAEGWIRGRFAATQELLTELAALREENARLKGSSAIPPSDTAIYAGGTDKFTVTGTAAIGSGKAVEDWSMILTWDTIFGIIGPAAFERCAEPRVLSHFTGVLKGQYNAHPSNEVQDFKVDLNAFQQIKIQLMALELVTLADRPETVGLGGSGELVWSLTPYGRQYLMKIRAIRKDA